MQQHESRQGKRGAKQVLLARLRADQPAAAHKERDMQGPGRLEPPSLESTVPGRHLREVAEARGEHP
jgi:hypothetical protein